MATKAHLKPWIWQPSRVAEFHWDSARLAQPLAAARRAQGELSGMARLLDPIPICTLSWRYSLGRSCNSAIEGERFDPNALRSSLARRLGLPLPDCPLRPFHRGARRCTTGRHSEARQASDAKNACWLAGRASFLPDARAKQDPRRRIAGASPMRIVSGPIDRPARSLRGTTATPPRTGTQALSGWFNKPPARVE